MARPVISNGSLSALSASGTTVSWTHTGESGKVLYVIIEGTVHDITTPSIRTCTYNGVAMTEIFPWSFASLTGRSLFIFSLVNPTAGANTILFTSSKTAQWFGGAFNVAGGPVDGSIILPGCYGDDNVTTLSRKGYAWDDDGTLVAFVGGTGTAITNGTSVVAGGVSGISSFDTADDEITVDTTRALSGNIVLCTFLLPPDSQPLSSGTHQIIFTSPINLSGFTISTSPSYNGLPYGNSAGPGRICNVILNSGTIRSLALKTLAAPGVGNTLNCEIYRGGSSDSISGIGHSYGEPTGISVSISGTDTKVSLDGIDLSFYRYERLTLVFSCSLGTLPAAFYVSGSLLLDLGTANEQVYGGGGVQFFNSATTVDVEYSKAPLHPMPLNWGNFPTSEQSLIGIDGEITELLVNYQVSVSLALDHDYFIKLNGILQDGNGGTVDTQAILINDTTGQALARSKFNLPVVAGDLVSIVGYRRSASATQLRQMGTIKFVPSIPGTQMISGHYYLPGSLSGYSSYIINNGYGNIDSVANEAKVQIIIPPLTALGNIFNVSGIRAYLTSAPGSGKSREIKLRKNLADSGISLTISNLDTIGSSSGDVDYDEDDELCIIWNTLNTPNDGLQFWTIPGLSALAGTGIIIVRKETGGNTSEVFGFTASGGLSPGTFDLSGAGEQIFSGVPIGSGYGIEETTIPSGWQQDSITVSNGDDPDNISVGEGETVVVTVVNSLITPANNPSGMYEMISDKTNDTIWVDATLGITTDVKIP